MQIIPISQEEALILRKPLDTSAVAQRMLFSISPLSSPNRRDSVPVNDTNLSKKIVTNHLQSIVDTGEEHREKYNALQNRIAKFNLG